MLQMVERINWMADKSEKGLAESGGIMVNYVYRYSTTHICKKSFHIINQYWFITCFLEPAEYIFMSFSQDID